MSIRISSTEVVSRRAKEVAGQLSTSLPHMKVLAAFAAAYGYRSWALFSRAVAHAGVVIRADHEWSDDDARWRAWQLQAQRVADALSLGADDAWSLLMSLRPTREFRATQTAAGEAALERTHASGLSGSPRGPTLLLAMGVAKHTGLNDRGELTRLDEDDGARPLHVVAMRAGARIWLQASEEPATAREVADVLMNIRAQVRPPLTEAVMPRALQKTQLQIAETVSSLVGPVRTDRSAGREAVRCLQHVEDFLLHLSLSCDSLGEAMPTPLEMDRACWPYADGPVAFDLDGTWTGMVRVAAAISEQMTRDRGRCPGVGRKSRLSAPRAQPPNTSTGPAATVDSLAAARESAHRRRFGPHPSWTERFCELIESHRAQPRHSQEDVVEAIANDLRWHSMLFAGGSPLSEVARMGRSDTAIHILLRDFGPNSAEGQIISRAVGTVLASPMPHIHERVTVQLFALQVKVAPREKTRLLGLPGHPAVQNLLSRHLFDDSPRIVILPRFDLRTECQGWAHHLQCVAFYASHSWTHGQTPLTPSTGLAASAEPQEEMSYVLHAAAFWYHRDAVPGTGYAVPTGLRLDQNYPRFQVGAQAAVSRVIDRWNADVRVDEIDVLAYDATASLVPLRQLHALRPVRLRAPQATQ